MAAPTPVTIYQPFADTGDKNVVPNTPSPTPGLASYEEGFPPITRVKIQLGGKPPAGKDFNGILYDITTHTLWVQAGGRYKFNSALATAIGGYSKGFVLQDNAGTTDYISLVNNNSVDFNTTPASIGVQWGVYAGQAANDSVTAISTTGGTVTLTPAQYAADIILVTGALASPSTIVFPAAYGQWKLINATTGAQPMVAKAPTGQSLTMSQGFTNTVFYDGVQLVFPDHDSGLDSPAFRGVPTAPTAAPGTNTTQIATTAFARAADTALLINTPLTGIPTAPTAAPLTNNTQIATTAYADTAAAAIGASVSAQYVNANFNAGSLGDLWTDTSAGGFTITLPDPPVGKNILTFRDIFGTWSTKMLTINPQTKTILGASGTLIANVSGRTFGMWYDTTAATWKLI